MKGQETDYLDKLFSSSSDVSDEAEVEFPLLDVPQGLDERLYAIAESKSLGVTTECAVIAKPRFIQSWSKVSSIAAGLVVAFMGLQFYQQQQTIQQLERAQADLATALHYLGEANRITQAQVMNSVNENMKKAGIEPAIEIGRESVLPTLKQYDLETKTRNRTL